MYKCRLTYEALKSCEITRQQYNQALTTAQQLQDGLLSDIGKFQNFVGEMLHVLDKTLG